MNMFGKKDKKADRKRGREKTSGDKKSGGGDLAAMFGLNMEIPGTRCVFTCVYCTVYFYSTVCVCVYSCYYY